MNYYKSIIIFGIRASVLLSKFLFTIYLAKKLSIDDFGLWILIFAVITYASILLGMEAYNISLRNYIKTFPNFDIKILSRSWQLYYCFYLIILICIGIGFFLLSEEAFNLFMIISLIIILEHCTLEIHRYGIFKDEQIVANFILLIKSFCWMSPFIYFTWDASIISIESVMFSWFFGCIACLLFCIFNYLYIFTSAFKKNFRLINFEDISRYITLLLPFLILSIAIRTPIILDRYLLEVFGLRLDLAVYGYYMSYGNGVQALFDAVIIAPLIPKLLKDSIELESRDKKNTIYFAFMSAIAFWIISIVIIYNLLPFINIYTEKQIFTDHLPLFILISSAQMIFSLSLIPQYYLYSINADRSLISGALIYVISSCILLAILIPIYGSYGAASSLMFGAILTLIFRLYQLINTQDKMYE